MKMTMKIAAAAGLLIAAPARAHVDDDAHGWGSVVAQGPVAGRLLVWLEGQIRIGDAPNRFRQILLRPAVGLKLDPTTSVFAGYALVRTGTPDALRSEHRLWQQIGYSIHASPAVAVTGRTRLEQRFLPGLSTPSLRLRQQLRVAVPLNRRPKPVAAVFWTEPFINLSAPGRALRPGIDRWRTQLGVSIPITAATALEPGYMAQYARRRGDDLIDHVALFAVTTRWK